MDGPCSRDTLRGCLRDIDRINRWFLGYRPLFTWLDSMLRETQRTVRILDAGCGSGDGLRRIARGAKARGIAVELIGVDMNPDAIAIATELSSGMDRIEWIAADIFTYVPQRPPDLVVSSLFAHHLDDTEIVRFLKWMEEYAAVGWFVNDLTRDAVPYHLFRIFAKVMRLHPFVQCDGPVSIARAFRAEDWRRLCDAAGLGADAIAIRSYTPARLCVARSKPR